MASFNCVPEVNPSLKYERLGPMAMENHRQYCELHNIAFLSTAPEALARPYCWGKFQVLLQALERFDWVIWADSDTLVIDLTLPPDRSLSDQADLITQCPADHFSYFGVGMDEARRRMPVNTGVFAIRACQWSKQLLQQAARLTDYADGGVLWNGIGDQEALTQALLDDKDWRTHVQYIPDFHCHPRFYRSGVLFVHLFGNRIEPLIAADIAESVIERWEKRIADRLVPEIDDLALLHLAATQCKPDQTHLALGDAGMILYGTEDVRTGRYFEQPAGPQ